MLNRIMKRKALSTQSYWTYVKHVKQKASINNVISNSKFSNKDILRFKLRTTTKFELKCPKTSIYSHFDLGEGLNWLQMMEFQINRVRINSIFYIEEIGIWQTFETQFELSVTSI